MTYYSKIIQEHRTTGNAFIRKTRLCEYFEGEENNDVSLVRNKSNFTPPSGRNEILETYASTTKTWSSIVSKENKKIKHNIILEQRNAIKSFTVKDNSIVIKEADKGGGIVIMNIDCYKRKVLEMWTDE